MSTLSWFEAYRGYSNVRICQTVRTALARGRWAHNIGRKNRTYSKAYKSWAYTMSERNV